ncbi:MAG: MipA/OmpV family protein [Campylobacterales bacterium]
MRALKIITLSALLALPLLSQESRLIIGGGVISSTPVYRDANPRTIIIPWIEATYGAWYWQGIQAGYRTTIRDTTRLRLYIKANFSGYEADDAPILAGMKRNDTLEIGTSLEETQKPWHIRASIDHDALGVHNGWRAMIEGGIHQGPLVGFAALTYESSDLVNYYFGIHSHEVRPNRTAYTPSAALTPSVGLRLPYVITPRLSLFAQASHQWLAKEQYNSPLVDQKTKTTFIASLAWRL